MDILNSSLNNNQKEEFIQALKQNASILHSEIDYEYAGVLYFVEFKCIIDEKQTNLDIDDYIHGIKVLNVIVDINKTIDTCCSNMHNQFENYNSTSECFKRDAGDLYVKISNPNAYFQEVRSQSFKFRYLDALVACKQIKSNNNNNSNNNNTSSSSSGLGMNETKKGSLSDSGHGESESISCGLLTHGDIQECLSQVDADYDQECLGKRYLTLWNWTYNRFYSENC